MDDLVLVSVFGGVVLGGDDETPPLPGPTVDGLHDVHQLLNITKCGHTESNDFLCIYLTLSLLKNTDFKIFE